MIIINKKLVTSGALLVYILICNYPVYGFDAFPTGARPGGLGNAFVSISDDGSAVFFNPAGTARIEKKIVQGSYNLLYPGLNADNIQKIGGSVILPWGKRFSSALGWDILDSKLLRESMYVLNLSSDISRFFPLKKNVYVGANIKLLEKKYIQNVFTAMDPLFQDKSSAHTVSIDFGALYPASSSITLGFAVHNINKPNLALKGTDEVDETWIAGLSYHFDPRQNSLLSLDFRFKENRNSFHTGLEHTFFNIFDMRVGFEGGEFDLKNVTAGFSVKMKNRFRLDYAYTLSVDRTFREGNGAHYVTMEIDYENMFTGKTPAKPENKIKTPVLKTIPPSSPGVKKFTPVKEKEHISKKSHKVSQKDETNYYEKGLNLMVKERYKAAISLFKSALKQEPENADIYLQIAAAYLLLENETNAGIYLEKVLSIQPDNKDAALLSEIIKRQ